MKKEALSLFQNPDLILTGFLLFFFAFLGLVVWACWRSNAGHFERMRRLPLTEETEK